MNQLSHDGTRIFDNPIIVPGSPSSFDYLTVIHPDPFEVDPLMAPVIATLLQHGYPTRFSCQGHIFTHSQRSLDAICSYLDQHPNLSPPDIPISAASCKDPNFTEPYIMFDYPSGNSATAQKKLSPFTQLTTYQVPNITCWTLEYCHMLPSLEDDELINRGMMDEDTHELIPERFSPYVYDFIPPTDDEDPRCRDSFVLRMSRSKMLAEMGLKDTEHSLKKIGSDYDLHYKFNEIISRELHSLYLWARELPEIKDW